MPTCAPLRGTVIMPATAPQLSRRLTGFWGTLVGDLEQRVTPPAFSTCTQPDADTAECPGVGGRSGRAPVGARRGVWLACAGWKCCLVDADDRFTGLATCGACGSSRGCEPRCFPPQPNAASTTAISATRLRPSKHMEEDNRWPERITRCAPVRLPVPGFRPARLRRRYRPCATGV